MNGYADDNGTCGDAGTSGTSGRTEIRMRDAFPDLGTVTWSEMVWSVPLSDRTGHRLRVLQNNCFGVPLVCGDVVETAVPASDASPPGAPGARQGPDRYPLVTGIAGLVDGILVAADGYAEISRSGPGAGDGPGVSDMVCDCGHCLGPGLDAGWWGRCETALLAGGATLAETDGDRIVAFFPGAGDRGHRDRSTVRRTCADAGLLPATLRLLDRTDREVFTMLRLHGGEGVEVSRTKGP